MDIDRVRYFCIFASTGSLVRASEILRISQPALSKALKTLEGELGHKLVEREGRGLRLTDKGRKFLECVEPLLQSWLNLAKGLQQTIPQDTLKIGSFEVFTTYFLKTLSERLPLKSLELHEYLPGQLEDAVADRRINIGITYVPIPKAHVSFVEVTRLSMGVFGHKSQARDSKPFVVPLAPLEGTPSKVVGLDGWPDHEYPRTISYRVALMQSALELCRLGLAVAYLPEFVVRLYNETVQEKYRLIEMPCPIAKATRLQSVYLIQRKGEEESATFRAVAKALRTVKDF